MKNSSLKGSQQRQPSAGQSPVKPEVLVTQINEIEDEIDDQDIKYPSIKKTSAGKNMQNQSTQSKRTRQQSSANSVGSSSGVRISEIFLPKIGHSAEPSNIQKELQRQQPHSNSYSSSSSTQSLRIFQRGAHKRMKSDKEELQFFSSPYHEKKYLGNELYPPEPLKIQALPNSDQDLFTYKPRINNPSKPIKQLASTQLPENNQTSSNMELEHIEYSSSPITVVNSFKNNPTCLHGLSNKKALLKNTTGSSSSSSANFVFMRTINLGENRKALFESDNQSHRNIMPSKQFPGSNNAMSLQQSQLKPQIRPHNGHESSGNSGLNESMQSLKQLKKQQQSTKRNQSQPRLTSLIKHMDSMSTFSVAKNNLIKYANQLKL